MSTGERILEKGKICQGGAFAGDGSRAAEAAIAFGVGVQLGSTPADQVKTYAGGTFFGIAVYDPTKGYAVDASGNVTVSRTYLQYDPVSVLRRGRIVVEVEEAVAAADPVYCDSTTGNFWKSAGAGRVLVSGAQFLKAATGDGELAELELNLP